MQHVVALASSAILALAGIAGCFIPAVPGPLLSYCGVLCLLWSDKPPSPAALAAFGVATVVVVVLDYVIPAVGARCFKCSKAGSWGAAAGAVVGIFYFPLGLVLGPFLGAFLVELSVKKSFGGAFLGGVGAVLGFLAGALIKALLCVAMLAYAAMAAM